MIVKTLIQTYRVPYSTERKMNKGKSVAVSDILNRNRDAFNLVSKDMHEGTALWKGMTKEEAKLRQNAYVDYVQDKLFGNPGKKMKSRYVQPMVQTATNSYFDSIKGLIALRKKGKGGKGPMGKPYMGKVPKFNLDSKHFSTKKDLVILQKGDNGTFWFSISSPYGEERGKTLNIPIESNKHVRDVLNGIVSGEIDGNPHSKDPDKLKSGRKRFGNKGTEPVGNKETDGEGKLGKPKATYALGPDGVHITVTREVRIKNVSPIKEVKVMDMESIAKRLGIKVPELITKAKEKATEYGVLGLDFGKKIALSNGTIFDMSKMYRKIERLNLRINDLNRRIKTSKESKNFDEMTALNEEKRILLRKTNGIRKCSYYHVMNKISKELKEMAKESKSGTSILAMEDLSFKAIGRNSEKYKGRGFNKMLNTMGRSVWERVSGFVSVREGFPVELNAPAHTSRCCSECGHVCKENRNGYEFRCRACESRKHADTNASVTVMVLTGIGLLTSNA